MNYYDVIEALASATPTGDAPLSDEDKMLMEELARAVIRVYPVQKCLKDWVNA